MAKPIRGGMVLNYIVMIPKAEYCYWDRRSVTESTAIMQRRTVQADYHLHIRVVTMEAKTCRRGVRLPDMESAGTHRMIHTTGHIASVGMIPKLKTRRAIRVRIQEE